MAEQQALIDLMMVCTEAFYENATSFTCSEANAIADAYRAIGWDDNADEFIDYHAVEDDEGDEHYVAIGGQS